MALVFRTGLFTEKGRLIQTLILPVDFVPEYQKQANMFLAVLFLYAVWNFFIATYIGVFKDPEAKLGCREVTIGLEAIAMVIPPVLPLAILVGVNMAVLRLRNRGIFTFQVSRVGIIGNCKVMCFDKTGTITEERMRFDCALASRPAGNDAPAEFLTDELKKDDLIRNNGRTLLTKAMASCHSLVGMDGQMMGNQVDLEMFAASGYQEFGLRRYVLDVSVLRTVKTFPFDHALQTMSVIVDEFMFSELRQEVSVATHVFCKGSYERIKMRLQPSSIPRDYDSATATLAKKGAYVLAIAGKTVEKEGSSEITRDAAECDLQLLGLIIIRNQVKEDSAQAFSSIGAGAIECKMITGDNAFTAVKVAREIKMNSNSTTSIKRFVIGDVAGDDRDRIVWRDYDTDAEIPEEEVAGYTKTALKHMQEVCSDAVPQPLPFALCITGAALSLLENPNLSPSLAPNLNEINVVPAISIFARVSPAQKAQIVTDIEEFGAVVGMCGDGGNDVSALRQATFGFALSTSDAGIAAPFSTGKKLSRSCFLAVALVVCCS